MGSSKFNFWNIEARDTIKLDNNNRLTFGGEFRTDGRKDSSIDESSDQYSLFIHDELKLGEKLLLIPAVRYDHHDSFGNETSPNIGATYSFTEAQGLRLIMEKVTEHRLFQNYMVLIPIRICVLKNQRAMSYHMNRNLAMILQLN